MSRSSADAYLEPGERATFDDHSLLVLEGEIMKVLLPVGAFGTDPFEKEEEQSCNGKRLI